MSDLTHAPACPRCGTEGYWLVSPPSAELLAGIRSGELRARIAGDVIEHAGPVAVWQCDCGHEWGNVYANEEDDPE